MKEVRCDCGKIVCQSDQKYIVIKCRHCKRFVFLSLEESNFKISGISFSETMPREHISIHC